MIFGKTKRQPPSYRDSKFVQSLSRNSVINFNLSQIDKSEDSLPAYEGPVHHNPLLLPRDEGPARIRAEHYVSGSYIGVTTITIFSIGRTRG